MSFDYDYIVVGSGFGGSVSALRLSQKGYAVGVMEMGRRWKPEDFPKTNWNLRRYFWRPALGLRGFFNLRFFRHVWIVCGNAVGGGSITYGNTLLVPPASVWDEPQWKGLNDWHAVMPGHYATAQRMLGVTETAIEGDADRILKRAADEQGFGDSFYRTKVAVFFPPKGTQPGAKHGDPYFGGEGPERHSCTGCGRCMVGCQVGAKNTLDKNYLYFAEKRGAQVHAETRVVDVRPLNGTDGADGYEVTTVPTAGWFRPKKTWRCRGVVFAASSLGTMELLFRLKRSGSLPKISDDLGKRVRTNAESVIGLRVPGGKRDLSKGVGIGSGIYIDTHTHIEATRFPAGSSFISIFYTLMTNGRSGWTRPFTWLATVARSPLQWLRAISPARYCEQTTLLLCMQTLDGFLNFRLRRSWLMPWTQWLSSEGQRIPTFIPQANAFAEKAAKSLGGVALSNIQEVFLNTAATAHCMGGCAMADSPQRGVIDRHNRVFGYQNLLVCDGSMLGANLGVNPSLTITALSEHAMSHIPPRSNGNPDCHGFRPAALAGAQ